MQIISNCKKECKTQIGIFAIRFSSTVCLPHPVKHFRNTEYNQRAGIKSLLAWFHYLKPPLLYLWHKIINFFLKFVLCFIYVRCLYLRHDLNATHYISCLTFPVHLLAFNQFQFQCTPPLHSSSGITSTHTFYSIISYQQFLILVRQDQSRHIRVKRNAHSHQILYVTRSCPAAGNRMVFSKQPRAVGEAGLRKSHQSCFKGKSHGSVIHCFFLYYYFCGKLVLQVFAMYVIHSDGQVTLKM